MRVFVTNARPWGIYYYYKDQPTWFQDISLYFYEVTRTRTPPYCFDCMIALVKADDFTTKIQSINSKQHFCFSAGGYRMFYSQLILCAHTGFRSLRTSGLYNSSFSQSESRTHLYHFCFTVWKQFGNWPGSTRCETGGKISLPQNPQ